MTKTASILVTDLTPSLLVGSCSHRQAANQRPDFRAALDRHIAAIGQRDLATLTDTLTTGDNLMVIFPAGQTLPTTADVDQNTRIETTAL